MFLTLIVRVILNKSGWLLSGGLGGLGIITMHEAGFLYRHSCRAAFVPPPPAFFITPDGVIPKRRGVLFFNGNIFRL
jgi:hypothetical protein